MNGWIIYLIICILFGILTGFVTKSFFACILFIIYLYACGWLYYKIFKWFMKSVKKQSTSNSNYIVKTSIIDIDTTYHIKGRLLASIIGDELFGDTGKLLGALHGTHSVEKNNILFLVEYSDGKTKTIKTKYNSYTYKQLIKYLCN